IGGGFRVPEIMAESGCRLVEVGTTNRTRRSDYAAAVGADTALVLKVHASNYRMVGFVESTPVAELTALGLPVMVDAGSGLLDETTPWLAHRAAWLRDEPGIRQAVEAGAGLVTLSGGELLGGPQAGVVVGRADLVAAPALAAPAAYGAGAGPTVATPGHVDHGRSSLVWPSRGPTPTGSRRRSSAASPSTSDSRSRSCRPGRRWASSTSPATCGSSRT